jgi:hypothetical protein
MLKARIFLDKFIRVRVKMEQGYNKGAREKKRR